MPDTLPTTFSARHGSAMLSPRFNNGRVGPTSPDAREEYYEVLDGRFLGGREFAEQIKAKAESPGYGRIKIKAEAFLKAACAVFHKKRAEVRGAGKEREGVRAREAICYVGRTRTELSVKSLAAALGVDGTCVSRSVSRVESKLAEDKGMKKAVDEIVAVIENGKYHA